MIMLRNEMEGKGVMRALRRGNETTGTNLGDIPWEVGEVLGCGRVRLRNIRLADQPALFSCFHGREYVRLSHYEAYRLEQEGRGIRRETSLIRFAKLMKIGKEGGFSRGCVYNSKVPDIGIRGRPLCSFLTHLVPFDI